MKKIIPTFFLCLLLTQSFGQTPRRVSTYLFGQYNKTITDRTLINNPWGAGLGLQAFLNNQTKFKPTIELTRDLYLYSIKVGIANPDGTVAKKVENMTSFYAGASYHPLNRVYLSFVAGPSFINEQTLLGIKPSVGVYFSENERWTVKCSYFNIFNRGEIVKEDFSSLSFAIGVRLF